MINAALPAATRRFRGVFFPPTFSPFFSIILWDRCRHGLCAAARIAGCVVGATTSVQCGTRGLSFTLSGSLRSRIIRVPRLVMSPKCLGDEACGGADGVCGLFVDGGALLLGLAAVGQFFLDR